MAASALAVVAQQFSPRYETRGDLVVIDVRGLERLFGDAKTIGDEIRRDAGARGLRVQVAIARTQTASVILAISRASTVDSVALDILEKIDVSAISAISVFKRWGLRTLGDLAALPPDQLSARAGKPALAWHALARGEDVRPLVPDVEDERFESALDLEWPIEGLEPLSFVLTRLLEPLSARLEQRDRGAAVLHVMLRLVTKDTHARRLELPAPMRDIKTLRTLALLDLEAHPPAADGAENVGVDRVEIVIEPTPGRVLQHTLFTRPHPTPEQLSTLLARLGAAMGQDRVGAPVAVDSYRPGAFAMTPFATEHSHPAHPAHPARPAGVVRRCRQPVPARVLTADHRPIKVTSDRRSFAGGNVLQASGPWKTSGEWWTAGWDRDEWDVELADGATYRVFLDHATGGWFIDGILD